jgi:hypothetical protein
MKTAVEIYKLLPKTNCGACGMPSCFGFAAKVAAGLASITACPHLSETARQALAAGVADQKESPGTVYEQALKSLQPKVRALDFSRVAGLFGAALTGPDTLSLPFLNEVYAVTKERITDSSGKEPLPFLSILIYNHLCMPDPPAPSGEWITFSSVPASHAKDKAWAGHVEEVVAGHFSGNVEGLRAACERMGGVKAKTTGSHDAAYEFRFFPIYPVLLLFSDALPEEGFPAQCNILLDRNVPHYLDLESMVVLGEEFAGRLTER